MHTSSNQHVGKRLLLHLSPVVSISLGNDCDFIVKNEPTDEPTVIKLHSGDIILFGGPSRNVLHTVQNIRTSTCPAPLLQLHARMSAAAPASTLATQSLDCFRMNLTFRHAPELLGHENDERFYFFAKSQRTFMETAQDVGVEEARRLANEKRAAKAAKKAAKKL